MLLIYTLTQRQKFIHLKLKKENHAMATLELLIAISKIKKIILLAYAS